MIFRFRQFTVDTDRFYLGDADRALPIEPLAFDLLVYLAKNRDRVVARDELLEKLWKGKVVTDSALAARLKDARRAVGDSGNRQAIIKTVHGRGYQFVAELSESSDPSSQKVDGSADFPSLTDKPSIAILPFTNFSGDTDQDYFSEGITADIVTALSKIKNLLVIARESTSIYRDEAVDVQRIGREQGAHYLLRGSVRKSANRIRVNVQLADTGSGQTLWAERYDRDLEDIFAVQDEIMREVVIALDVHLVEGEQARAWASGTTNLQAWECLRQGAFYTVHRVGPEFKSQARQLIERALEFDPGYAIAWVMLGWIYQQYVDVASLARTDQSRESSLAAMLDCAHKAIEADPGCADAWGLLAMYHLEIKAYDQALEMAEKSIALAPNNAENLGEASMILNKTGNPQRALELKKRAMRICPVYRPGFLRGLGLSYYLLGQPEAAVRAFEESIARESDYLSAHTSLAAIHGELGNRDKARAAVGEILRLDPDFSIGAYIRGLSFRDAAVLQRIERGLRDAGAPD